MLERLSKHRQQERATIDKKVAAAKAKRRR